MPHGLPRTRRVTSQGEETMNMEEQSDPFLFLFRGSGLLWLDVRCQRPGKRGSVISGAKNKSKPTTAISFMEACLVYYEYRCGVWAGEERGQNKVLHTTHRARADSMPRHPTVSRPHHPTWYRSPRAYLQEPRRMLGRQRQLRSSF